MITILWVVLADSLVLLIMQFWELINPFYVSCLLPGLSSSNWLMASDTKLMTLDMDTMPLFGASYSRESSNFCIATVVGGPNTVLHHEIEVGHQVADGVDIQTSQSFKPADPLLPALFIILSDDIHLLSEIAN